MKSEIRFGMVTVATVVTVPKYIFDSGMNKFYHFTETIFIFREIGSQQ